MNTFVSEWKLHMLLLTGHRKMIATVQFQSKEPIEFANGYDVQVAKKIAESMNKELLVVKTKWEGLVPALTSGKIDMIIAGMSPTEEQKKKSPSQIAIILLYQPLLSVQIVNMQMQLAYQILLVPKLQLSRGVYLYDLIDQIEGADKQTAMGDFSQIRQALEAGVIDAYVSERPEGRTAGGC